MSITGEMSLDEMLRDPIVRLVMRRDGVKAREVRAMMRRLSATPRPRGRSGG
jgi:hypothetical protein